MAQYLNRKYTLLQFLDDTTPISSLTNVAKIKTIYRIDNNIIKTWEHNANFNDFSNLETYKTYLFINKNIETQAFLLHNNTNKINTNISVNSGIQIVTYTGECPSLPINYFNSQIQRAYKVSSSGLGFDVWINQAQFNTFRNLTINETYLIYSYVAKIPYDFISPVLYSLTKEIVLDIKCDSSEVSTYLSEPAEVCSSEILADTLDRCISNIIPVK